MTNPEAMLTLAEWLWNGLDGGGCGRGGVAGLVRAATTPGSAGASSSTVHVHLKLSSATISRGCA